MFEYSLGNILVLGKLYEYKYAHKLLKLLYDFLQMEKYSLFCLVLDVWLCKWAVSMFNFNGFFLMSQNKSNYTASRDIAKAYVNKNIKN